MRYGLIVYKGDHGGRNIRGGRFNVGDNIQMYAMRRIYLEEMGIPAEDIVEIDFHELGTYDGEYLIVPVNLFFAGCSDAKERWFPASAKIIPVFIGVHFSSNYLTEEEVAYMRMYAPIGCRDAYTLKTMRKYNIPAYLFGCITATLPKRKDIPAGRKTYIVDVDPRVVDCMPEVLKKDVCYTYHEEEGIFTQENFDKMDRKAEQLLREYSQTAGLVVTSRLHCAAPCVAMGIPTVMVVKERSSRFAWLDSLIPIYTVEEVCQIKWNAEPVSFEELKSKMTRLVCDRLREAMQKWTPVYEISSFFESGACGNYVNPNEKLISSVDQYIFLTGKEDYIIWGTTAQAEQVYQHVRETYPEANLIGVIDLYNSNVFHGCKTTPSLNILCKHPRAGIVVTPSSAKNEIKKMIQSTPNHGICVFHDGDVFADEL